MIYIILAIAAIAVLYFLLSGSKPPAAAVYDDPEMSGQRLRGTRILGTAHGAEVIARDFTEEQMGMTIAGVRLPRRIEPNSMLMQGGPGSGKSLAFIQALTYAREAGHRCIVVDNNGEFLRRFYKPGDVICNVFDARSEAWSLFAEMNNVYDAQRLAQSIAPDGIGENKVWSTYSQTLIASVLQRLWEKGGNAATNGELVRMLTVAPVAELRELCAGLPAITLLEEGAERMFAGIRADVGTRVAAYAYLHPQAGGDAFSLTKFVKEEGDGWVYLSYRDDQFSALKSMLAAQLDILISATLSLIPDPNRRIFFALDEFATLGKIQSIDALLSKGRRFGGCGWLGLQSISQLHDAYGKDGATTILACLGTWLNLRSPDSETADVISKYLGKVELLRHTQSGNTGANGGSSGWSEQIVQTEAIMPSQLQGLADRHGYLNVIGPYFPIKVEVPLPPAYTEATPGFVDRDFRAEAQAREAAVAEAEELDYAQVPDMTRDLM